MSNEVKIWCLWLTVNSSVVARSVRLPVTKLLVFHDLALF